MRKLARPNLPTAVETELTKLTNKITNDTNPKARAEKLWKSKGKAVQFVKSGIRTKLEGMASGRGRCMYCEDSAGTDIEHFRPKAKVPAKTFDWKNHLLACSHCNSNLKRTYDELFADGEPKLLNPTADDPRQHLALLPGDGTFTAIGRKGQPSIDVFGLNDTTAIRDLPGARKDTLLELETMLAEYDRLRSSGRIERAEGVRQAVVKKPLGSMLVWLVDVAARPAAPVLLGAELTAIIRQHRIDTWLEDTPAQPPQT